MTRAEEYAKMCKGMTLEVDNFPFAWVTKEGNMKILGASYADPMPPRELSPAAALRLADWIIATFK